MPIKKRTMMEKSQMGPSEGAAFVPALGRMPRNVGVRSTLVSDFAAREHITPMVPREDEPNLYNIPSKLSPIYKSIPYWIEFLISTSSLAIVSRRIITSLIQGLQLEWTVKKVLMLLFRYIILWSAARIAIQETFFHPSRVSTQYLSQRSSLPSLLSNYQTILPKTTQSFTAIPIGVHSLQYHHVNQTPQNKYKYAAIQFHHGFGASSLSWLPILPLLTQRLGAKVGIAHDAPGFGFTDRPNADGLDGLRQYQVENSVGIGMALLEKVAGGSSENENKKIAIFGHSMGAKAALLTALGYSKDKKLIHPGLVVLVAPALEGVTLPMRSRKKPQAELSSKVSGVRRWLASFWIVWRKLFVDWPFTYVLRRLVGTKNFWRKGLLQAWGDPRRLSDSDVMRFQWPSIGRGWERGLISFGRAVQSSDDAELLRQVADLPDTTVVIVYGTKDNVVKIGDAVLEKLKSDYPTVNILRMEGLGHDPFEEDKEAFLSELEKVLYESKVNDNTITEST
ncbi:hypothetical protein ACHAXN_003522 [Cyclotella atomus]